MSRLIVGIAAFAVVLLLDAREIRSVDDRFFLADQLRSRGVVVDVRALPLGDAIWVARRQFGHDAQWTADKEGSGSAGKRKLPVMYNSKGGGEDGRFLEVPLGFIAGAAQTVHRCF